MVEICRKLGREDIIDCVELGVSELVTNAVLHGAEPISVRVRGTASHPRVEVHDGSTRAPVPPSHSITNDEDTLTTFGRGLDIVARTAIAWGASIEPSGKIVWFEPATDLREGGDLAWIIDRSDDLQPEPIDDGTVAITLQGMDLELYRSLAQQYAELRRELRLLSLGHQDDYPLAVNLTDRFSTFERQFPLDYYQQIHRGLRGSKQHADIHFRLMPESSAILVTMAEMFDVSDAFCRAERLLSLARTPVQREFSTWLLDELISQLAGHPPRRWRGVGAATTPPVPQSQVG